MSDEEFKRALGYANTAIALLKTGLIPPHPQFFELLYTYATGVNVALNARINAIFKEGEQPTIDIAQRLYDEFLRANDAEDRITSVSQRMSARIEAVHDAIDAAMATANSYSGSLRIATGDLENGVDSTALKAMSLRLLEETRHMQHTNSRLEQQLVASRDNIESLQRDMDEVRRESLLDPLTKIFNRKCFDEGLVKAIDEAISRGEPLSLVMLDIDHFKAFNDVFGHQTGDQVLRLVAMTLKSNTKGRDLAARYGGEEFAAILPSTDLKSAAALCETLRRAIHAKELFKRSTNEKLGRITASFGVASLQPTDTAASFIERADRCLYAAKHAGRNNVVAESDLANSTEAA